MSGTERSLLYRLAVYTGLRWNELRTLSRSSVNLKSHPFHITALAKNTKNKKTQVLPLRCDLAMDLALYISSTIGKPSGPLFATIWQGQSSRMLQKDLKAANIEFETEDGVVDFHALRHTFGTWLARAGVLPQVAQRLMRHSSIDLTMNLYTHLKIADSVQAVELMPDSTSTVNLTENPPKTGRNGHKTDQVKLSRAREEKDVTPVTRRVTRPRSKERAKGFEPSTFSLGS